MLYRLFGFLAVSNSQPSALSIPVMLTCVYLSTCVYRSSNCEYCYSRCNHSNSDCHIRLCLIAGKPLQAWEPINLQTVIYADCTLRLPKVTIMMFIWIKMEFTVVWALVHHLQQFPSACHSDLLCEDWLLGPSWPTLAKQLCHVERVCKNLKDWGLVIISSQGVEV